MTEPLSSALLLSVLGVLVAISVLFSRAVDRIGVPIVLLFLVLGMLGGSEGLGRISFDNYELAVRIGTMALVLILFDGGLNTSLESVRRVLYPAGVLATFGVFLTALFVALLAYLCGIGWTASMLLGAVVSSTDAAAVFAVLRGGHLSLVNRLGRTLEVESCINDPMAVILTTSLVTFMSGPGGHALGLGVIWIVPLQLLIGAVVGVLFGYLGRVLLRRVHLTTVGLYPALTLAIAFLSYGVATIVFGSGFLAVFTTGLLLGNGRVPYRNGLRRIHDALGWLSQIAMFLMLGLLVKPSHLLDIALPGLAVGLGLASIARPLAVLICLVPFRYRFSWPDIGFIGWVGLRGAVPIILATFPVLAGLEGAEKLFDLVLFIVVVSSVIPGATIRWLSHKMGVSVPEKPTPAAVLEISTTYTLDGEIVSYYVDPSLAVCGAALSEIEFPADASVVLVVRGTELVPAKGRTVLEPGDHVYLFIHAEDKAYIELLFGAPEK